MFLIMQISDFPLDDTKIPLKKRKAKCNGTVIHSESSKT